MALSLERVLEALPRFDFPVWHRHSCLCSSRPKCRAKSLPLPVPNHHHVDRLAGTMILEREGHVIQILDARSGHLHDAIAAADARLIGRPSRPHVGEQHAAALRVHGSIVGDGAEVGAVAAAVSFQGGGGGETRVGRRDVAARERLHDPRSEIDDARGAGVIQRLRAIIRRVIPLVRSGEEMEHRDALGVEAGLIRRAVAVAARNHIQMRRRR